jgi:hypothetical protein
MAVPCRQDLPWVSNSALEMMLAHKILVEIILCSMYSTCIFTGYFSHGTACDVTQSVSHGTFHLRVQ